MILDNLKRIFIKDNKTENIHQNIELIKTRGDFIVGGRGIYNLDIIKSCIRPKASAIGKATGKHIRKEKDGTITENPLIHIDKLLTRPNPIMSNQMLLEKLTWQLMLNNNAFAVIIRDDYGKPKSIYPADAKGVQLLKDDAGNLYLNLKIFNGDYTFPYTDIIHLRRDFNNSDFFGDSITGTLESLVDLIVTTDAGLVKTIKNSNDLRWLIRYPSILKPEDIKRNARSFEQSYLNGETQVVATDSSGELIQLKNESYVPDNSITKNTINRIYSLFNINENIIQNTYNHEQWYSFYTAEIKPILNQLSDEYTEKLFSQKERAFGNKIIFDIEDMVLSFMADNLTKFYDRGIMSIDEIRDYYHLPPLPDGKGKDHRVRKETIALGEDDSD